MEELSAVYAAGGRTMVDTMPANCGRNVVKLAEVSRRSGIEILAPTGLHLEMYYPPTHWRFDFSEEELAEWFIADIEVGIDAELLQELGVDLTHVVISHVDQYKDAAYHRELLQSGVRVEYDSAFRWKEADTNWTYLLLEELLPEFPEQITVGMDAARNSYWHAYGGKPGLIYLLTSFRSEQEKRGLATYWHQVMTENPRSLYTLSDRKG